MNGVGGEFIESFFFGGLVLAVCGLVLAVCGPIFEIGWFLIGGFW